MIAPAAVAYGFLITSPAAAKLLLQHFGYFTMLGTFVWWLYAVVRIVKTDPAFDRVITWGAVKRHCAAWVLITGLVAVAWFTVPYSWKVLYDELVLQSTALNLHFFRELGTMVRGHEIDGVFRSLDVYLDKRPFFYPFLVSLVHDLTGYRTLNAYVLNTALMPVVLGLVYVIGRWLGGQRAALVAVACFGASPLLAQNANGVGMEMLNLVMILVTLGLAVYYLRKPDAVRLSALVLSCVLLAQTRYESALYVGCVALAILEGWRRVRQIILPPAGLCAPLLLIPCALHNTYLSGMPMLWELRDDVSTRFGVNYLGDNLRHAVDYFFGLSIELLNAWWLSIIGVLAIGWVGCSLWSNRTRWRAMPPHILVVLIMGLGAFANLGLLMFYYWGQLDDTIVSRLSLPVYAVLAFAVAWVVGQVRDAWQPRVCGWLLTGALLCYLGLGLRSTAYNNPRNQLATEMTWEEQWVAQRPQVSRLIITNKTALNWIGRLTSAIPLSTVRTKADKVWFHMKAGTFREVLVSQYYRPVGAEGGFVLDPKDTLPDSFVLEPLTERQVGGKLLRISRVSEIRLPAAPKELPSK
ncbi:MAG: glycosyltransferase family 39 protein [Opitutaceae bacterium]|jgi:hypothetical protein